MKISKEELKPYRRLTDAQQNIRSASDFTDQVMDYYMSGERLTGIKLPFKYFDTKSCFYYELFSYFFTRYEYFRIIQNL